MNGRQNWCWKLGWFYSCENKRQHFVKYLHTFVSKEEVDSERERERERRREREWGRERERKGEGVREGGKEKEKLQYLLTKLTI